MVDVNPISSAPSQVQLAKDALPAGIVHYIHREIVPELRLLRGIIGLMLSNSEEESVMFGDDIHLATSAPSATFTTLGTTPAVLNRQVRTSFDPTKYPAANIARSRNIYLQFWMSASAAGGTPEVALFNEGTGFEITGTRQAHTGGTTATRYLKGPLVVSFLIDQLINSEATYTIRGRDAATTVNPIIGQARFLVRYE